MPPNHDAPPLIEILENLAPPHLHAAAWATCSGGNWNFGHASTAEERMPFWKMDLNGDAAFDAIWQHAQARCEELAGGPLKVIRQYANGHTYGLGGSAHIDDNRPDTFTLLYYPNPEWRDGWEGETVFFDNEGELALAVRLRPNRAILFDSRIPHNGRAPSRGCHSLRVSVAYKLEKTAVKDASSHAQKASSQSTIASSPEWSAEEISRDGAKRVYAARVAQERVSEEAEHHLSRLSETIRLPEFRAGKIPRVVLEERYGARARFEALKKLAARIVQHGLPEGSAASACELRAGQNSGDMEIAIAATHLPDLPQLDLSRIILRKLTITESDGSPDASAFIREDLKSQVLDVLHAFYPLPLFSGLVEREFSTIWKAVNAGNPIGSEGRADAAKELREIAERRVRLGLIVAEMARRYGINAQQGPALEDGVIEYIADRAQMTEQRVTLQELQKLMNG